MTSTRIEPMERDRLGLADARRKGDPLAPVTGHNVPTDHVRALEGVLWSVTLARLVLVPVFLAAAFRVHELALQGMGGGRLHVGLLLTLAVIAGSDILDGWLARRFGLQTQAGAVADAVADKAAQLALVAFFAFVRGPAFSTLPVWFFILLVGRDAVLGAGWAWLRAREIPIHLVHRVHGRAASVSVFALLFWIIAGLAPEGLTALVVLSAALIWVSAGAYVADTWIAVRAHRARESSSSRR